jgi:phosphatidylinositol 4-kinase
MGPVFSAGAAGEPAERSSTPATTTTSSGTWPCFKAGAQRVVAGMEARFVPHLEEAEVVQHVLELISSSIDAISTRQYDFYQRVLNGIL